MNDKQKAFADKTATFAIAIGGDERTFDIEWNKKSRDLFPWSDYEEIKKYYMEKILEKKPDGSSSVCKPGATWETVCKLRYSCVGCQFNRDKY